MTIGTNLLWWCIWHNCKSITWTTWQSISTRRNASSMQIDLLHKSHKTPVPYPEMHHFVTEMCTYAHISTTKWCVMRHLSNAFWDLWAGSVEKWDVQNGDGHLKTSSTQTRKYCEYIINICYQNTYTVPYQNMVLTNMIARVCASIYLMKKAICICMITNSGTRLMWYWQRIQREV